MNNKKQTNTKSSSQNNSNTNPFPKLKPKGSIMINHIPKKTDNNNTSQNNNFISNQKKSDSFLSKLRIFDPNPKQKINSNSDTIRHSKTIDPSFLESINDKKINKDNKDNIYETKDNNKDKDKDIDDILNINKEKENFIKKKLSCDIEEKKDIKDIKDTKRSSIKNPLESAKKIFSSLSGYLNENIINRINTNYFGSNKDKDKIIDINFEKPPNFDEIEKSWNYGKILIDNNILDFTSKSYKYIFLIFNYSYQ